MAERGVFLSVVLPCRDQGDHIGEVLSWYAAPLNSTGKTWELVVVPNACTDNTMDAVRHAAAAESRIRIVENPRGGWGLSVRAGLQAARGELLCYANSARTEPAILPRLLELYFSDEPCLAKVRRQQRGAPVREAGSWLFNAEARFLFGIRVWDINGTPKMFPRSLYDRLELSSEGDLLDLELLAKVTRMGVPVVELPVSGFARHGGRSGTTPVRALGIYAGALGLRLRMNRRAGKGRRK